MKASSSFSVEQLRDPKFTEENGTEASIMDYARFNYVAQPEDSLPLSSLIPRVGTYDAFATMWGYKPIPGARTPEQERATLDQWARQQDTVPWFRFSTSGGKGSDSGEQSEAIGDANAVKSTELGLRNIKRIVPMLMTATTRAGEDNSELSEIYGRLIGQWRTEMGHVANVVGGAESQEKYGSQTGARFTPFPREKQRNAIMFLNENVFRTPTFFLDPAILRRIEPDGAMARVRTAQMSILSSLLGTPRLVRLIEFNALATDKRNSYTVGQMLGDVRRGIWSELSSPSVRVDAFRRNLQYAYLDQLAAKINPPAAQPVPANLPPQFAFNFAPMPDEARAQMRNELMELDGQLRAAASRSGDQETRVHLAHARHRIDTILYPNK
ncbi:MAG: zinc-dependent metalloprotease, partial [Gemmatimonadota bacterium]|nr:zinc-dependent metalloprotease [Gemmatimonadota bacterium]